MSAGAESVRRAPAWGVAVALGIVYVVWGSTYAGIRYALDGFPPFLLGGIRFLAAGTLLLLFALAARHPLPSRRQLRDASIVGVLLLCMGNGGVVWAEQHVASGLAAVIVATVPLWMLVLDAAHPRGERLTPAVVASFLLGLAGVGVLTAGGLALGGGTAFWLGIAALLGASFTWALGSIYARYAAKPTSYAVYTALEMLAGGAALTGIATLQGEWGRFDLSRIPTQALWGELYLIFFGSLLAFSAYVWLLRAAPPALVGTYAYVNPVVALLLGVLLFGETLDRWTLGGSGVILVSVILSQWVRQRKASRVAEVAAAGAPGPSAAESIVRGEATGLASGGSPRRRGRGRHSGSITTS